MNRFRTKKKTKEEAPPRVSNDSDSPAPFRLFGKNKKTTEEEPRKEIDLATALPSSDDFRTSLLMTGLSARFSMLKEQDDPTSKIGKASDDSVLFPKRQSRMLDFGFGPGLGDIAEVESIRGKAPFARMDSFHSSEGSTSGSIMDRAKPVDGNNLFGGRQKIYKLPSGGASTKNLDGGMSGRALYGDDVAMSSFQRWRQSEKDRQPSTEERQDQVNLSIDIPRAESPPAADVHRKRETNSSMSSAPSVGRNSTAATSVTSQPNAMSKDWQSAGASSHSSSATPALERSVTRTRRLYETGLLNDLHEQQNSALSRMDTLSRQRNLGSRTPDMPNAPSPTTGLFTDRFGDRKLLAKASAPNLRSMSPPMVASSMGTLDFGTRVPSIPESKTAFGTNVAAPLSPPISESEERSPLTIQPNDLGKATSMGVFNKPAQQYDETKYAQKQIQLQQGLRQHLRSDSDASSIYGGPISSSLNAPKSMYGQYDPNGMSDLSISSNPWDSQSPDWQSSYFDSSQSKLNSRINTIEERPKQERKEEVMPAPSDARLRSESGHAEEKEDDFARHLADGARRVRERLTSYVESDSRSVSPQPSEREPLPSRSNPLHLLISKSSRGSLVDRSREREQAPPPPKVNKMLGIGASTMSSSPSPSKRSFDFESKDALSPMEEEPERSSPSKQEQQQSIDETAVSTPQSASKEVQEVEEDKEEGMHAGLPATSVTFRAATHATLSASPTSGHKS
ncbi:Aldehyde dehydrogenase, dimeric NADP-preferring [Verticillium dahliae VDG1]|nr:Aldehyde dehydrogenase, dimeric NADP-preferring [Verticillium dahliae VDG1]